MIGNLRVLAIIPARGKSKRLRNKNILPLNGKPLMSYSIEDARETECIDRIIVSTDSETIAIVAKKFGAEAPFLRPANISGDRISDYPVIAQTVKWLEEKQMFRPDIIVFLRPTTPLREQGLVDKCLRKLVETKADSVRTVRPVGRFHPYWMLKLDRNSFAKPFMRGKTIEGYHQEQSLPKLYEHDGYCDVIRRNNINVNCSYRRGLKGMYGKKVATLINEDGKPLINIDTAAEFELAEFILRRQRGRSKETKG